LEPQSPNLRALTEETATKTKRTKDFIVTVGADVARQKKNLGMR
jgi:hypothetical protein